MSYSLFIPCCTYQSPLAPDSGDCVHKNSCTDRHVIQGAISAIHSMPFGVGHKGAGSIELKCCNKIVASPPKEE